MDLLRGVVSRRVVTAQEFREMLFSAEHRRQAVLWDEDMWLKPCRLYLCVRLNQTTSLLIRFWARWYIGPIESAALGNCFAGSRTRVELVMIMLASSYRGSR